jgi:hypothetical protein
MADLYSETSKLNGVQKANLLEASCIAEKRMAMITMERSQLDIADGHCKRCLTYARQFTAEGHHKTTAIFTGLCNYVYLRRREGKISTAVTFVEEALNLVVVAYDPVHLQVQEAAGLLIQCLIKTGNFFDAERYAEVTYSNLRDRKNGILQSEKNFGNKTKNLLEQALANLIKNEGVDGVNVAGGNCSIGQFYLMVAMIQSTEDARRAQLLLAKSYQNEAYRIETKLYGPNHPQTISAKAQLSQILNQF